MSPLDKFIILLVVMCVVGIGLWWAGDSIIDSIRAPVVARAEKAESANATVIEDNAKLQADIKRLNDVQKSREDREAKADQRLKRMEDALKNLAKTDPVVRDWLTVPVPDGIIGLRAIPETGTGNPNPKGSVFDTLKSDRAGIGAASAGKGSDERGPVGPSANAGNPAEPVQQPPAGRSAIPAKQTLMERIKKAWD